MSKSPARPVANAWQGRCLQSMRRRWERPASWTSRDPCFLSPGRSNWVPVADQSPATSDAANPQEEPFECRLRERPEFSPLPDRHCHPDDTNHSSPATRPIHLPARCKVPCCVTIKNLLIHWTRVLARSAAWLWVSIHDFIRPALQAIVDSPLSSRSVRRQVAPSAFNR